MSVETIRNHLVEPGDHVVVAFDKMGWPEAVQRAQEIGPYIGMAKTNSLHQRRGTDHTVSTLARHNLRTMLDPKFHDIPETVEDEVREVTQSMAALITVHISGGEQMLRQAVRGRDAGRELLTGTTNFPLAEVGGLIGITILTSLDDEDCERIYNLPKGEIDARRKKVVDFAFMGRDAGLDGLVCSVLEVDAIRAQSELDDMLVVTPGITPTFAQTAPDQKRTGTPAQAINAGADLIVVGRGINQAANYGLTTAEAAQAVAAELAGVV